MLITKADGEREEFNPDKLRGSLSRAGASDAAAADIIAHIERELAPAMTTGEIYRHAFDLLRQQGDRMTAARYSLRRAMLELGPSGFAFETFIAEIFKARGYATQTDVMLNGECIGHEIDVLGERAGEIVACEAKFHNAAGYKTDLKVALYIHSRARDLAASDFDGRAGKNANAAFWLVTNTKFTTNAIRYGTCAGLSLIGWNYPEVGNLQDMIEETALHPITCLTTLSGAARRALFDRGIVLCRDIKHDAMRLRAAGLSDAEIEAVRAETERLCVPRQMNA